MHNSRELYVPTGADGLPQLGHSVLDYDDTSEVVVKTIEVGVCGTDLRIIGGEEGAPPAGCNRLVLGHEGLGRVIESPFSDIAVGSLVVGIVRDGDDKPCEQCARGRPDLCLNGGWKERGIRSLHGFMRDFWAATPSKIVPVPEILRSVGVLVEPASVVAKAIRLLRTHDQDRTLPAYRDNVLVIGGGTIGLLMSAALRLEMLNVAIADPLQAGSHPSLFANKIGARYQSFRFPDTPWTKHALETNRIIVDAAGVNDVVEYVASLGQSNSTLCLLGMPQHRRSDEIRTDVVGSIVQKNLTIFGSVNAAPSDFSGAIELLSRITQQWPHLLESSIRRFGIDDRIHAFTERHDDYMKSVLVFDD